MYRKICTTDPISLGDIPDTRGKPYLVEGDTENNVVIYFESEENKRQYLAIPVEHPCSEIRLNLDNPTDDMIDEG